MQEYNHLAPGKLLGTQPNTKAVFLLGGMPVALFFGGLIALTLFYSHEESFPEGRGLPFAISCLVLHISMFTLADWVKPKPRPGQVQLTAKRKSLWATGASLVLLTLAIIGLLFAIVHPLVTAPGDVDLHRVGPWLSFVLLFPVVYFAGKTLQRARRLREQERSGDVITLTLSAATFMPGEQALARLSGIEAIDPNQSVNIRLSLIDEGLRGFLYQRRRLYTEDWTVTAGRASDGFRFTIPSDVANQAIRSDYRGFDKPRYWELSVELDEDELHQFIVDVQ